MAKGDKIKVPGYAQRIFFNDGIEYRPFSPDIVGNQEASEGNTSVFTNGNFSVTTNLDPKSDKIFTTNSFSNFITLTTLNLTHDEAIILLSSNAEINLNLDKKNLNNYAYFGSLVEFIRVSLENIILNWPASLYITPIIKNNNIFGPTTGYTLENYNYDLINNTATFRVSTNSITNKYNINFLINGQITNTLSETNDLRNLTANYNSYSILNNNIEYDILNFTGATNLTNDYIYFKVNGNPFSGTSNGNIVYHIKPKKINVDKFFNILSDFESYVLNRQILPVYTATFKYPIKSDEGVILYINNTLTWPVSDGYNIDFDTTQYIDYANTLLEIATDSDNYKTNLISRFFVSESISSFDTAQSNVNDIETAGQKVDKTLKIYGREFDEIKNFIDGIEFSNTVTYNKEDNTPDIVLKNLARVLGWELTSSLIENDLLKSYIETQQSTYSGQTVGLTTSEAEFELWRRIILNTPWLWKSKGTRKGIEFLFKFIGAPNGLITFNEYIYTAQNPINIDIFKQLLTLNNLDSDITSYNIDNNGYPKIFEDTPNMYFQKGGLWYRETGGSNAIIDILKGNNPHVGPYDGGYEYINQFNKLIPSFSAVTISGETLITNTENLFVNYNLGFIDDCSGPTYQMPTINLVSDNNLDLSGCYVVTSEIVDSPHPTFEANDCGCITSDCDQSLKICVKKNTIITSAITLCNNSISSVSTNTNGYLDFNYNQYDINGNLIISPRPSIYANPDCCGIMGGKSELYTDYDINNNISNIGYICCTLKPEICGCFISCKWVLSTTNINSLPLISGDRYLEFLTPNNQKRVVTPDGCNCISSLTIPVPNITDPNTGAIGFGCKITANGVNDLSAPLVSSVLYNTYRERNNGSIGCSSIATDVIAVTGPTSGTTQ